MRRTGLWRHADFLRLWAGQTISLFGSKITFLALPLTAVLVLDATPTQMGILTAVEALPFLLVGLFAGAWVDRYRRRPILIVADLGRAVLLMVIPVAALLGTLRIEYLYVVGFLVGVLGLFFEVAYRSFLPSLVGKEQLVEGNSKLELGASVADIVGPGLAGGLMQLAAAPLAIAVDALTFLISALFLGLIRTPESPPQRSGEPQNIWREVGQGLRLVYDNKILRGISGCIGTLNLFNSILEAIFILYLTHELNLEPGLLGLIFASGSVGFVLGALLQEKVAGRLGIGKAIIGGLLLTGVSDLLIPLLAGSMWIGLITLLLMGAQFFFGLGLTTFKIGEVSLRQSITPDNLQGRMNATVSFIGAGVIPLGGLLGGVLGEMIGLRSTLFLAAFGEMSAVLWLLFSPLRILRNQPIVVE